MRIPKILVVEDNPTDVRVLKWAMSCTEPEAEFTVVDDGELALAFLTNQPPYEQENLPDLVVLDVGLKRVDGLIVLEAIRKTERLHRLSVVILSVAPNDAKLWDDVVADGYFNKPLTINGYIAIANELRTNFLQRCR